MADKFDAYHVWLGIPPTEQPPTHYRLLGLVEFESDPDVIANAADRQMAHLRTLNTSKRATLAQKLLNEISAAQGCLLDSEKKSAYDVELKRKTSAAKPPAKAAPPAAKPPAKAAPGQRGAAAVAEVAPTPVIQLDAALTERKPAAAKPLRRYPAWIVPAAVGGGGFLLVAIVAVAVALLGGSNRHRPPEVANIEPHNSIPEVPGTNEPPGGTGNRHVPSSLPPPGNSLPEEDPFVVQPDPAAVSTNGKIDLLKTIDPVRDSVQGNWSIESGVLVSPGTKWSRLQIPVVPPEEYVLTAEVQRMTGWKNFGLGIVVGGRQTRVVFDAFVTNLGAVSGLTFDSTANSGLAETARPGKALADQHPTRIVCTVRKNSVRVSCNGNTVINWSGDVTRLSNKPETAVPDLGKLFVATFEGVFRVSQLALEPLNDSGLPPPDVSVAESMGYKPGLVGEYVLGWANTGAPVAVNVDPLVRLDHAESSASPVPADDYAIRWSGYLLVPKAGRYTFRAHADDDVTLWIDEQIVAVDRWNEHSRQMATVPLEAGLHRIRVLYRQQFRSKFVGIAWALEGSPDEHEIGSEYLYHDPKSLVPVSPGSVAAQPAPGGNPQPATPRRLPVPDAAARSEAEKLARELYARDIAAARKSPEKVALAQSILAQAQQTTMDATARYVLLAMGRDLAVEGGDASLALGTVRQIADEYDVDLLAEKTAAVRGLGNALLPPAAHKTNVELYFAFLDELEADDRFEHATDVGRVIVESARRAGDPALSRHAADRIRLMGQRQAQYGPVKDALGKLADAPHDPDANLTVGRWHWFVKDDLARALPHLAKGSNEAVKSAAAKELAPPAGADAQFAIAEAWSAAAQAESEPEKTMILIRSHHWYRSSAGGLVGLAKAKADKSAADLQPLVDRFEQQQIEKIVAAKRATGQFAPGLLGDYFRGTNFDQKLGTRVDSGVGLEFALAAGSGVPSDFFSIRWTGYLVPPKPGRYRLVVQSDDGVRVYVDGKAVINAWRYVTSQPLQAESYVTLGREPVPFQVEYYQWIAVKGLVLSWEQEGGFALQPIAPKHFYHAKP
jgi:hypothetical protein